MKRYIQCQIGSASRYFRAVPNGEDPREFKPYELGIHCGSLELAEYIRDTRYNKSYDIYEIFIHPACKISNTVDHYDGWNCVVAIESILVDGYNVDISRADIVADFNSGALSKDDADDYIKSVVGDSKLVVRYYNQIDEEDGIIILDDSCIQNIVKI